MTTWGEFSEQGKLDLVAIDGRCNSEKCCEMLNNNLLPYLDGDFVAEP